MAATQSESYSELEMDLKITMGIIPSSSVNVPASQQRHQKSKQKKPPNSVESSAASDVPHKKKANKKRSNKVQTPIDFPQEKPKKDHSITASTKPVDVSSVQAPKTQPSRKNISSSKCPQDKSELQQSSKNEMTPKGTNKKQQKFGTMVFTNSDLLRNLGQEDVDAIIKSPVPAKEPEKNQQRQRDGPDQRRQNETLNFKGQQQMSNPTEFHKRQNIHMKHEKARTNSVALTSESSAGVQPKNDDSVLRESARTAERAEEPQHRQGIAGHMSNPGGFGKVDRGNWRQKRKERSNFQERQHKPSDSAAPERYSKIREQPQVPENHRWKTDQSSSGDPKTISAVLERSQDSAGLEVSLNVREVPRVPENHIIQSQRWKTDRLNSGGLTASNWRKNGPPNKQEHFKAESAEAPHGRDSHVSSALSDTATRSDKVPATCANEVKRESSSEEASDSLARENSEEMVRLVLWPPASPSGPKVNQSSSPVEDENKDAEDTEDTEDDEEEDSEEDEEPEEVVKPKVEEKPKETKHYDPLILLLPKKQLDWFKECCIFPLKQMNIKFPRAFLHCRLCSFHMSSIPEGFRHANSDRHMKVLRQERIRATVSLLPDPSPTVAEVIDRLVLDVYRRFSPTAEDMEIRRRAADYFRHFVEASYPGTSVRLYGSCFTGLALRSSSVNVGLMKVRDDLPKPLGLVLYYVFRDLDQTMTWSDIREDLSTRVPVIHFRDVRLNVQFCLGIDNENAFKTSCLLQQYQILDDKLTILVVVFRAWARLCQMDQPDLGTLPSHAYSLMTLYFLQQSKALPVLHLSEDESKLDYSTAAEFLNANQDWKRCSKSVGQLWLDLLKFYGQTFTYNDTVVCVRSSKKISRSSKHWGNRRLAIEDPFHPSVNMASPLSTPAAYDYYLERLRQAHLYFWTPQIIDQGPLFTHLRLGGETKGEPNSLHLTVAEAMHKMDSLKADQLRWVFQEDVLTHQAKFPLVCLICGKDGHSKTVCPELSVPKVGPLLPIDLSYCASLNGLCFSIFQRCAQSDVDFAHRERIRQELELLIRKEYKDAKLSLFGSSCNGFGFSNSDLDLCLTFDLNPDGKGLDLSAIVKKLARFIRRNRSFVEVVPIASAKVPIVKLRHKPTGLESDISLYNRLGQRNSELLATYSKIDLRVRILGFMAKLLAKKCGIGDASRGSLSSYAYTLMVLHFLQQIKPSVIPVLQEIEVPGLDRSRYIVEGWDTWFFDDLDNLGRVWRDYAFNPDPPGLLWLKFLHFYAEVFDFRHHVVCIRQLKPLHRLEKMWTDRPIAIEDPFDLNHNLGAGISPRMGAFIRRVFVNACRRFHTSVVELPPRTTLEAHLFNTRILIPDGPPANDRGCLICGKVGHKAKECQAGRKKSHAKKKVREVQPHKVAVGKPNDSRIKGPAIP